MGLRLRALRVERGLSLADGAAKTLVSLGLLSALERALAFIHLRARGGGLGAALPPDLRKASSFPTPKARSTSAPGNAQGHGAAGLRVSVPLPVKHVLREARTGSTHPEASRFRAPSRLAIRRDVLGGKSSLDK